MKMLTVFLPEKYIETMDLLVLEERFPNRSEAIRSAVRDMIQKEILFEEKLKERKENIQKKMEK